MYSFPFFCYLVEGENVLAICISKRVRVWVKYIVCDVREGQECQLDKVATLISTNETFQAYTDV